MQVQHRFEVQRPIGTVWDFFQDVPSVAQCLPGAELLEVKEGGIYSGKVSIKLGPMSATFEGDASVTSDAVTHSGLIDGKGVDRRGGSRGQVKVTYRLASSAPAVTGVEIDADVQLSGAAAQFGRTGLINEMSNRLIAEFVSCVEAKLAASTAEEAEHITAGEVKGISLFFESLIAWIRRIFRR
jgi:carbon-monoxide dehydrogenase small subunit